MTFYPQEDISFYLDPERNEKRTWHEPPTKKELTELFEEWPVGTSVGDVFPHCKTCFNYPIIEDNVYLYLKLTKSNDFRGLFAPLDFFNLLYEKLKYCLDRVDIDSQIVIDHLTKLNLVKRKLHFLLYSLHYIINGLNGSPVHTADWPEGIWLVKNEKLARFHLNLIFEYKALEKELGIDTGSEIFKNTRPVVSSVSMEGIGIQKRFTHPQIALIHIYEKIPITNRNSSAIANKYGFFNPSSGESLRQDYEYYLSNANRLSAPATKKKFNNKIILFESVLEYLSDTAIGRAKEEIHSLKTLFENTDW